MPAKNSRKTYVENGVYHIYNRGVEKRKIFIDEQDYAVFLSYLKSYLTAPDEEKLRTTLLDRDITNQERNEIINQLNRKNFKDEISLLAYCLMPNHFHFLIKQSKADSIARFTNSFLTRFTRYFNKRYERVGGLYQGVYKAVLVTTEPKYLELLRYIHRNPTKLVHAKGMRLEDYPYSSHLEYLGKRKTEWVDTEDILSYFSKTNKNLSYKAFVDQKEDLELIESIAIDH